MSSIQFHYTVDGNDFTKAGEASSDLKRKLKKMHVPPEIVRRVSIAMYEGEINMVIHAYGGVIDVDIDESRILMVLRDRGPGIPDIEKAMQAGYSTASDKINAMGFGAGMGLPNMKASADSMHIDTELGVGTTVTMQVDLA